MLPTIRDGIDIYNLIKRSDIYLNGNMVLKKVKNKEYSHKLKYAFRILNKGKGTSATLKIFISYPNFKEPVCSFDTGLLDLKENSVSKDIVGFIDILKEIEFPFEVFVRIFNIKNKVLFEHDELFISKEMHMAKPNKKFKASYFDEH